MDENEKAFEMKKPSKKKMKLSSKIFIVKGIVGSILTIIGLYLTVEFWNKRFYVGPFTVGMTLIGIGVVLLLIPILCALPAGCYKPLEPFI